jgi:hypothetical protein
MSYLFEAVKKGACYQDQKNLGTGSIRSPFVFVLKTYFSLGLSFAGKSPNAY